LLEYSELYVFGVIGEARYINWYQSFGYPLMAKLLTPKRNPLPKHIAHKEPIYSNQNVV